MIAIQHICAFVLGAGLVLFTLRSAIRTFVLPRSVNDKLTRQVFFLVFRFFVLVAPPTRTYEWRDRVMALYAPVALLCLPLIWVTLVSLGYTGMFWSIGAGTLQNAFTLSGSSVLTLGFEVPRTLPQMVLAFSEATIGLLVIALLIAYLPTIYGAFSRREINVTKLEVRADSPPSAVIMLQRFYRLDRLDQLTTLFEEWENWFTELEETHTSFGALALFRSSHPDHSWVTAAGAVLDGASLLASTLDIPRSAQAELCIRAGYLSLRRIADFFQIPYVPIGDWSRPISVTREEYDMAVASLAEAGVPLVADREKAWRDFVGWRVNYDAVLLGLATLTIAPYAPWSSDRAIVPLTPRKTRGRRLLP